MGTHHSRTLGDSTATGNKSQGANGRGSNNGDQNNITVIQKKRELIVFLRYHVYGVRPASLDYILAELEDR